MRPVENVICLAQSDLYIYASVGEYLYMYGSEKIIDHL